MKDKREGQQEHRGPKGHRRVWVPGGVLSTKPRHYREMLRVAWRNRDQLPFAARILRHGVCDGCALGTSGLRDWTIDGVHLCMVRLDLLRLNTMPALDLERLRSVAELEQLSPQELRDLGRLPTPLLREPGEAGFRGISWEEALDLLAREMLQVDPERAAFYLTSRGIPNETYYVAQKAARFLGTAHVDNSARLCHAASTVAMKRSLGHGASTGSYRDWMQSDLIVFFGSNVANNQPVTLKYVEAAKKRGAQVAVVNPYLEPGMDRYWIPSSARSAAFGTQIADTWFQVDTGGDLAFLNGVLKALIAWDEPERATVDRRLIAEHTEGFEQLAEALSQQSWAALEAASGTKKSEIERFAALLIERPKAILVWSMGLTQHEHGVGTVQALVNLGLARGLVGKPGVGLTPIRGHSGVQGGAEVGCVPVSDAALLDHWAEVWGFDPPRGPGLTAMEQIAASARGAIDLFWILGGNFVDTTPDPEQSRRALARPRLRVHQDIVLNSSMLVEPEGRLLLLPATTRYEMAGGVTETTTERRIVFSPEIAGRRIAEARPEWQVLGEAMARAFPERAEQIRFSDCAAIRREIAQAIPLYAGIEELSKEGDQFQWGGASLFADGRFATSNGKARFVVVEPPTREREPGELWLSTRRGRQFNSIVHRQRDALNGARRDELLISETDLSARGLEDGEEITVRSKFGEWHGRARSTEILPGNVEIHWPEGNVLLGTLLDRESKEPDYGTKVRVEPRT